MTDMSITPQSGALTIQLPPTWERLTTSFLANQRSSNTMRAYRSTLDQFFHFLVRRGNVANPNLVTADHIIAYIAWLREIRQVAPSTICRHLAALSSFFEFARKRGLRTDNPTEIVNRPEVGLYSRATWLTANEARALLSRPDRTTLAGKRDFAIMTLMLLTGMRCAEVTGLKVNQLERRGGKVCLRYIPKGGRETVRELPSQAWEAIEDYLRARRIVGLSSPLFVATTKAAIYLRPPFKPDTQPLASSTISRLIAKYAKRALGPDVRVTPHSLRHTAASILANRGVTIDDIQELLGHRNPATTRRYMHVLRSRQAEIGEEIARELGL